ncbi:MAG: SDR family oxidoreductase, partial [Chloroflexota bacterium]
ILVNNAGLARGGPLINLSREDWDAVIETHLTGSFLCAKHAARAMIARGEGGKIIKICSMFSIFGPSDFSDYALAKTGILGLTRALAVELAQYNIQVNAILPGWYETGLTGGLPEARRGQEIRRKTPAGRWGQPEELVGTAVYLASSASDFVTGVCIPVDGGYAISERFGRE